MVRSAYLKQGFKFSVHQYNVMLFILKMDSENPDQLRGYTGIYPDKAFFSSQNVPICFLISS